jgi:hypothetical protein
MAVSYLMPFLLHEVGWDLFGNAFRVQWDFFMKTCGHSLEISSTPCNVALDKSVKIKKCGRNS